MCEREETIGKNRFEIHCVWSSTDSKTHVVRAVPRVRFEGGKVGGRPGPAMRTHAHRAAMGRGAQTGRVRRRDGAGNSSASTTTGTTTDKSTPT